MLLNKMGTLMKMNAKNLTRQAIAATACAGLLLAALVADAAGLGAIAVQSSLGQPLVAQVEITTLQAGEFDEIKARIASRDTYENAKLAYVPVYRLITITAERRADGSPILRLSSNAPVNEPVIDLLVELTWNSGKIVQKYSILLDPAK